MAVRFYSSTARTTALTSGIDGATTSITVDATTGFPTQFPFTLAIDIDTTDEELVDVTAAAGNTLTVTRGVDGTVGLSHEAGAVVKHVGTGRDWQDSRDHEEASTDVHGVGATSSVVGTETVQTLEGKTMDGGLNTFQNIPQAAVTNLESDQATQNNRLTTNEGNISSVTTDLSNHEASTAEHGVGIVAGVNEAQTLTNKVMSGSNNTFSAIPMGGLDRVILHLQSNGDPNTVAASSTEYNTTFTTIVNIGNFGNPGFSAERTVPRTGLYLVNYKSVIRRSNTSQQSPAGIRIRVGGSIQDPDSGTTVSLAYASFGDSGDTDHVLNFSITDVLVLNAGDLVKFLVTNFTTGGNVVVDGNVATKTATLIFLGPSS